LPDDIVRQVAEYYAGKLAAHGPTAPGVDWNSETSQALRHRQFLRLFADEHAASILDLGCGYGDFLPFLRQHGFTGTYVGYDVAPEMIEAARRLHGEGSDRAWRVGAVPDETADYAIASGIFNVKGGVSIADWTNYLDRTIGILARSGTLGFAFNVLSLSSDPEFRRSDLYYADPVAMLAMLLERYGRAVALLQDYGLYEFTVLARKT